MQLLLQSQPHSDIYAICFGGHSLRRNVEMEKADYQQFRNFRHSYNSQLVSMCL